MMKGGKCMILSVLNKKGGVGKTSGAGAIASILAGELGMEVLCIDLDPQCNLSEMFHADFTKPNIGDLFEVEGELDPQNIHQLIQSTDFCNIDLICGSSKLDYITTVLAVKYCKVDKYDNLIVPPHIQTFLSNVMEKLEQMYNFIIIDNSPFYNLISENSLSVSNAVLIPVQADGYSYNGLAELLNRIYKVKGQLNSKLDILGVYFNNVKANTTVAKSARDEFKKIGDIMLDTVIRPDIKVCEANTAFAPLYAYNDNTAAVLDYMNLITEVKLLNPTQQKVLDSKRKEIEALLEKRNSRKKKKKSL